MSRQRLATYIADQATTPAAAKRVAKEVAALLLHDNTTAQLDSLLRDVRKVRAERGSIDVTAVSAHPLSDQVVRDLQIIIKGEFPTAKHINISTRIEPDVVGGVRLEMPDEQMDLTIRSKLAKFRHLTDAIKE